MNQVSAKTALWFWVTVALAATGFAAGQAQLPDEPGKKILDGACTACHNLDRIVSKQYDKDSWDGIVQSMRDKGATVSDDEAPVLVEYLTRNFGKPQ
jgi:cytochrome c5